MMFLKAIGIFMGVVAILFLCAIILWYWFNKENEKMTKSEIEQNAEEYTNEKINLAESIVRKAYIAGALSRQPEIDEAKEVIQEFMRISVASVEEYEPEFSELIDRAEQFLGE